MTPLRLHNFLSFQFPPSYLWDKIIRRVDLRTALYTLRLTEAGWINSLSEAAMARFETASHSAYVRRGFVIKFTVTHITPAYNSH